MERARAEGAAAFAKRGHGGRRTADGGQLAAAAAWRARRVESLLGPPMPRPTTAASRYCSWELGRHGGIGNRGSGRQRRQATIVPSPSCPRQLRVLRARRPAWQRTAMAAWGVVGTAGHAEGEKGGQAYGNAGGPPQVRDTQASRGGSQGGSARRRAPGQERSAAQRSAAQRSGHAVEAKIGRAHV